MRISHRSYPFLYLVSIAFFFTWGHPLDQVWADDDIILVPFAPNNLDLPHPVHERAQITLKGIVRNATCNSYRVTWDTDRDGNFETNGHDFTRQVSPSNNTLYDISAYYEVPEMSNGVDQRWPINVQVLNLCNQNESLATYKMFVYAWSPSPNPKEWSEEQIELMSQVSLHEGLWYLHRRMSRGGNGSQIHGYIPGNPPYRGSSEHAGTAIAIWSNAVNGRLPAYPPNSLNGPRPNGWDEANEYRWNVDPYAESVMRMVNHVLRRGTGSVNISSADEATDGECGIQVLPNGSGRRGNCTRIPGTQNSKGAYTNGYSNSVYWQGVNLGSLASILPALAGTKLQSGGLDQTWEFFIQELTDYIGYMQIDGSCGKGGWYYNAINGSTNCHYMDASTAQWGYIGLESAEVFGGPYGVVVTNRHKYRIAQNAVRNTSGAGAAQYRTSGSGGNNLMLTGGTFVAARWLNFDQLQGLNQNAQPFLPYSDYKIKDFL
jgi:hypothetical protein